MWKLFSTFLVTKQRRDYHEERESWRSHKAPRGGTSVTFSTSQILVVYSILKLGSRIMWSLWLSRLTTTIWHKKHSKIWSFCGAFGGFGCLWARATFCNILVDMSLKWGSFRKILAWWWVSSSPFTKMDNSKVRLPHKDFVCNYLKLWEKASKKCTFPFFIGFDGWNMTNDKFRSSNVTFIVRVELSNKKFKENRIRRHFKRFWLPGAVWVERSVRDQNIYNRCVFFLLLQQRRRRSCFLEIR